MGMIKTGLVLGGVAVGGYLAYSYYKKAQAEAAQAKAAAVVTDVGLKIKAAMEQSAAGFEGPSETLRQSATLLGRGGIVVVR
jgi:uncharacterized membrane protein YebE (DUF533 family)